MPQEWGDGSNRWIPGTVETLQGEGKNDIAGVFDAAALNFDEGVGGLASLVDDEPGNTAGPGTTEWEASSTAAEEGYAAAALQTEDIRNAALLVGGAFVGLKALQAFAEGAGAGVTG